MYAKGRSLGNASDTGPTATVTNTMKTTEFPGYLTAETPETETIAIASAATTTAFVVGRRRGVISANPFVGSCLAHSRDPRMRRRFELRSLIVEP